MTSNPVTSLAPIDYAVMAIYFAAVLGVGWSLRRAMRTSGQRLGISRDRNLHKRELVGGGLVMLLFGLLLLLGSFLARRRHEVHRAG